MNFEINEVTMVMGKFLRFFFKTIKPTNFKLYSTHFCGRGQDAIHCQAAIMDFKVTKIKKSHVKGH